MTVVVQQGGEPGPDDGASPAAAIADVAVTDVQPRYQEPDLVRWYPASIGKARLVRIVGLANRARIWELPTRRQEGFEVPSWRVTLELERNPATTWEFDTGVATGGMDEISPAALRDLVRELDHLTRECMGAK